MRKRYTYVVTEGGRRIVEGERFWKRFAIRAVKKACAHPGQHGEVKKAGFGLVYQCRVSATGRFIVEEL